MSWNDYVNTSLVGTGSIDKAAIYGVDGLGLWAGSEGFALSQPELQEIAKAFTDKSKIEEAGLHAGGVKYFVIKADERSLYGMKGKEGILIVKSVQAIVVAHYPPGIQAGSAATVVEALVDYLIKAGY